MSIFFHYTNVWAFKGKAFCLVLLLCAINTFAEASISLNDSLPGKRAVRAAQLCQNLDFIGAQKEIDEAILDESEAAESYTWYVRGFVYKEIYKNQEISMRNSPAREKAVDSFFKAKSLNESSGPGFNNDAPLRYLINTYYNDALNATLNFEIANVKDCYDLFAKFESFALQMNDSANIQARRMEWKRACSMRYYQLWNANPCDAALTKSTGNSLNEALELDQNNCIVIYNLAAFHYKFAELEREKESGCNAQDAGVSNLNLALNELHQAERLCPHNREIVNGLLNVYRIMQNETLVKEYELKASEFIDQNKDLKN